MKRSLLLSSFAILGLPSYSQSLEQMKALSAFVQNFYDWYAPVANKNTSSPAFGIALKSRRNCFTPELANALQIELNAQTNAKDAIVGLDWDPFLDSQDPENHYKVGSIKTLKDRFLVNVHAVLSGKLATDPSVQAEVLMENGKWKFSNFHGSQGTDLLASLAGFRKGRQSPK